jgi:hypothetical protein
MSMTLVPAKRHTIKSPETRTKHGAYTPAAPRTLLTRFLAGVRTSASTELTELADEADSSMQSYTCLLVKSCHVYQLFWRNRTYKATNIARLIFAQPCIWK